MSKDVISKPYQKRRTFFGLHIDDKKTPYILLGFIFGLWFLCWFLVSNFLGDWTSRGQFGDMFGTVNALFSGLAFAGIIYTILLQREELEEQRKELRLTRKEFKAQNRTLSRQNFETTFFNLLSNHQNQLQQVKIETTRSSSEFGKSRVMNIGIGAIEVMNKLITPQLSRLELKNEKLAETEKIILHEQFDYLMREKESQIVLYFQSLATILFAIGHTDLIPENGKTFYFQILNSQITPQEKTFIFYYMSCSRKEKIGGGAFATLHRVEHKYHFMRFSDVRLFHKSHRILVQYWEDIYKEIDP